MAPTVTSVEEFQYRIHAHNSASSTLFVEAVLVEDVSADVPRDLEVCVDDSFCIAAAEEINRKSCVWLAVC